MLLSACLGYLYLSPRCQQMDTIRTLGNDQILAMYHESTSGLTCSFHFRSASRLALSVVLPISRMLTSTSVTHSPRGSVQ